MGLPADGSLAVAAGRAVDLARVLKLRNVTPVLKRMVDVCHDSSALRALSEIGVEDDYLASKILSEDIDVAAEALLLSYGNRSAVVVNAVSQVRTRLVGQDDNAAVRDTALRNSMGNIKFADDWAKHLDSLQNDEDRIVRIVKDLVAVGFIIDNLKDVLFARRLYELSLSNPRLVATHIVNVPEALGTVPVRARAIKLVSPKCREEIRRLGEGKGGAKAMPGG